MIATSAGLKVALVMYTSGPLRFSDSDILCRCSIDNVRPLIASDSFRLTSSLLGPALLPLKKADIFCLTSSEIGRPRRDSDDLCVCSALCFLPRKASEILRRDSGVCGWLLPFMAFDILNRASSLCLTPRLLPARGLRLKPSLLFAEFKQSIHHCSRSISRLRSVTTSTIANKKASSPYLFHDLLRRTFLCLPSWRSRR